MMILRKGKTMGTKMTFKPAVVDGRVAENYFIRSDGNAFSNRTGEMRMLTTNTGGQKYPKVRMRVGDKTKTYLLHRIVCETWHEFPIPPGVTKPQWDRTLRVIKQMMRDLFQVNHKDHVHTNYHPSNLEWVTVKQNAQCYREHVKKQRIMGGK